MSGKSPSLRRIKADIRELSIDPSDQYHAAPLEHDMFEWHFTIRGAADTDFAGGIYHGRILLPPEYPFKPPNIVFLTPSGRFETGVKVCLSFSAHHPELWQPAWGIRLILEALISFLPTPADGALGALDWTSEERKKLARESLKFRCPVCCCEGETCVDLLPKVKAKNGGDGKKKKTKFQEEIEKLKMLQFQNHASSIDEDTKEEEIGDKKKEDESKEENDSDDKEQTHPKDGGEEDTTSANPLSTSPPQIENKEPTSNVITGGVETKKVGDSAAQSKVSPAASQQTSTDNTTASTDATTPPLPANNTQPAVTDDTAPTANTETTVADIVADAPIISDSILNTMIGFFAVIVLVLLRQAQTLVDELQSLGGVEE